MKLCERCELAAPLKNVTLCEWRIPLLALDLCQECIDVIASVMASRQSFSKEKVDG